MIKYFSKVMSLLKSSADLIKSDGFGVFFSRAYKRIYYKLRPQEKPRTMKDVLFIVGSNLPQVKRFRVDHQMEQLISNGLSAECKADNFLNFDDIKYYRCFVFCRYPYTQFAEQFIKNAKSFNKTIIFEIDDLVFDKNITSKIVTVASMDVQDRALYDSGVERIQNTLQLCDYAITTTEPLKYQIQKYKNIKDIYVNRNVASDKMIEISNKCIKNINRKSKFVTLGYFSGSITHNEDFEYILPDIIKLMEKYDFVRLKIVGILKDFDELSKFGERVQKINFLNWKDLPKEIRECDINLAPYFKKNIFNDCKSEIKWIDASLVKTITVASDFGAFKTEIVNNKTGILVKKDSDWYIVLEKLINDKNLREYIADNAYQECVQNRTTINTGKKYVDWLLSIFKKNVIFVLPSAEISGGVNVVLKHVDILTEHGYDVTILNNINKKQITPYSRKLDKYNELMTYKTKINQRVDEIVATLWATLGYAMKIDKAIVKSYFVQNYETDFIEPGRTERLLANSTYCCNNVKYTTMSLWCKKWLLQKYGQQSRYASNGLWSERYKYIERDFINSKIKILIEGDPKSKWKNVDEAFMITNKLDRNKFEINFLSYNSEPKNWYKVDNFYQKIEPENVGSIYVNNHILLKTSILESFSYPPLEMMATGGVCVVLPNDGNKEYLKDGYNCLFYKKGDISDALEKIDKIVNNKKIRYLLIENGMKTAKSYSWDNKQKDILNLYN